MEYYPPLHLSVVAIKKGAFGLPSSKVANFTYYVQIKLLAWNTWSCLPVYKIELLVLHNSTWNHLTVQMNELYWISVK